jgi:very-short-patch-repair endonuclease
MEDFVHVAEAGWYTSRMPDRVEEQLRRSRVELLDLSLRNPLLNYRPSKRRGLEIVDEASPQVFTALVVEGQALRFHPTKESEEAPAGDALFFVDEAKEGERTAGSVGVGEANPGNSLATPHTKEALARRLLETHYDAWLSVQEQGANTLFLALGMLRWRENEQAKEDRLAPLVLVPVALDRKSVRAAWQLTALDEEPGPNLSLIEKLKESGLALPAPDLETAAGLEAYLGAVEQAVADRKHWAVERNRIVLGFFSFGKFLMYRDLDPAVWPADRSPVAHPLLSALLAEGFRERGAAVGADEDLDAKRPPGATMEVVDCDGSQAEALAEVAAGRSLVIQGPPGTGKSQTISNLIAEAVSAGKRVLFVAEKMAALEVVQRRLGNIGLAELCLELHSHKASRKHVAGEVDRTLKCGRPEPPPDADLVRDLPSLRDRVNRTAKAVSTPVGKSETTPFQAIGALERIRAAGAPPKMAFAPLADWTRDQLGRALALAKDLAAKVADLGAPDLHPFAGCGLTELLPGGEEKIAAALGEAKAASEAVRSAAGGLAAALGWKAPEDAAALEGLCELSAVALEAPELPGLPPIGPAWNDPKPFDEAAAQVRELGELRKAWQARLIPEAWVQQDLLPVRQDLAAYGWSFWSRLFSSKYRAAKRRILALSAAPLPRSTEELVAVADAVLKSHRLKDGLASRADAVKALLGERWKGLDSDWDRLLALRAWTAKFRQVLAERKLPEEAGVWVVRGWDREAVRAALGPARTALEAWRSAWGRAATLLAFPRLPAQAFEEGARRAAEQKAQVGRLPGYVAYWKLHEEAAKLGLGELAALAHSGSKELPRTLEQAWAEGVLDRAFRERPELRDFDAVTHEQAIERFRRADAAVFASNRAKLAELHWKSLPGGVGFGQVGRLRRECAKKARHMPIRRLMEEAGAAVQAAKPVFLMSPLSVASYLPPGGPSFDLVVFDEASQVKPVDAFGALLRGRQLVVVGDEKQMPPTSFFDSMLSGESVPEEEETSVTQDLQSILGLCTARGMPSRMLRWHYRSRHDSLIALSNREFYENRLVVFPSPFRALEGEGLSLRHLAGTVYERGTTRTNPKEADAVAEAVLAHAKTRPELSLGVAAFSQPQREAVEARVEALARMHPELDRLVNDEGEEPFFVKNLENVQGDERDVMLVSVGYGRDGQGQVSMNFGPLNQAGGERRLNVLITRARRQCVVFTNLRADDLDLKRAPGEGVRAFKAWLAFAEKGRLEAVAAEAVETPEFESQVRAALAKEGFEVESQVGSGGYRLDLALVDPAAQGRYVLGLETDGARYQSARWARDRDRLRQAVLRGLGWSVHRIWCADWFRNRGEALRRCREAAGRSKAPEAGPRAPIPAVKRGTQPPPGREPVPAYVPARVEARLGDEHLANIGARDLAEFLAAIVDQEAPIHVDELNRRVLAAAERRPGSRTQAALDEALAVALQQGRFRKRGDFLWPKEERPVAPRDRSKLADASRDLSMVCDEECHAALRRAFEESCGCDPEEAAVQAIHILGVKRNEAALARLGGLTASHSTPSGPRG